MDPGSSESSNTATSDSADTSNTGGTSFGSVTSIPTVHFATNGGSLPSNQNVAGVTSLSADDSSGQNLVAGDVSNKLTINLALVIPFVVLFGVYLGIKKTISYRLNKV